MWRPVAIGIGSCIVAEVISTFWFDSYAVPLVLYVAALILIWNVDLEPQTEPYLQRAKVGAGASWIIPCLAGAPAALIVLLVFVVVPLIPPNPREVCQQFLQASSAKDAKQLTTNNLWPALDALAASPGEGGTEESSYEILAEETAPADMGGHLVGYRTVTKTGSRTETIEGIVQLVEREGRWKIEEIIYTSFNGQPFESPVRLSQSYRQIVSNGSQGRSVAVQAPTGAANKQDALSAIPDPLKQHWFLVGLGRFLATGGLKKAGLALLALLSLGALGTKKKE